ncbi:MAG: hypothetical protein KF791_07380 [Verrucomicrobiae bacterium]|nr:hypothetical protein [Verrucomicrobiae bacterium]
MIAHILISLLVGGGLIATCSLVAERAGPDLGGLIAGLPSTLMVSLLFVGLGESPEAAARETTFIPLALGVNCFMMGAFGFLAPRGLPIALGVSLATWIGLAALAALFPPRNLAISLTLQAVFVGLGFLLTKHTGGEAPAGASHCSGLQILFRGLFGGSIVATSVLLSHIGGPLVGGVASAFPAIGISSLVIVSNSRGIQFATALLRPTMVSTCVTMLGYVLAVRYAYPALGLWTGTAVALTVSLAGAWVLYAVNRRQSAMR